MSKSKKTKSPVASSKASTLYVRKLGWSERKAALATGIPVYFSVLLVAVVVFSLSTQAVTFALTVWLEQKKAAEKFVEHAWYFWVGFPTLIVLALAIVGAIVMFPTLKRAGLATIIAGLLAVSSYGRNLAVVFSLWCGGGAALLTGAAIQEGGFLAIPWGRVLAWGAGGIACKVFEILADIEVAQVYLEKYAESEAAPTVEVGHA